MLKREITLAEEISILVLAVVLCAISVWFGMQLGLAKAEQQCKTTGHLFGEALEWRCEEYKP